MIYITIGALRSALKKKKKKNYLIFSNLILVMQKKIKSFHASNCMEKIRRVVNISRLNLNTGKLLLFAEHFRSLFTSESFDITYFLIKKKYSISLILPLF